jgi:hypothetical protein
MGISGTNWELWYIREAGTAILAANILLCRPLLRKIYELWMKYASGISRRWHIASSKTEVAVEASVKHEFSGRLPSNDSAISISFPGFATTR